MLLSWPEVIHADGGIAAWQEVRIASETGGLSLTAVLVDVGDRVVRGQELALLNRSAPQADFDVAQASVQEAEASLEQAQADAMRAEGLVGTDVLSQQQILQYRIAARTADAKLASARAQLANRQLQLDRTHIVAPDDGIVSSRTAALGAVVSTGGELFRLIRQGRVEWHAEVIANDLLRIIPGQPARVALPDGTVLAGAVRAVAPVLDDRKRTGLIYVTLPTGQARPGMFATGEILVGEPAQVLTVPASAVMVRDGRSLVFTVDADGTARERRVATGRRQGDRVEITTSLDTAARIVVTGGAFLSDGDHVAIAP
jgi:RND family efflux transporter MFP subunit